MKIILLTDVKKVGQRGTIATVADGYANNVLIPRKLALHATPENLMRFERSKEGAKAKVALDATLAKKTLADIDTKEVAIQARANDTGTLFESIHPKQIAEAIGKQFNIAVPEGVVTLIEEGPIKKLGNHRVEVKIHGISAELTVVVSKL